MFHLGSHAETWANNVLRKQTSDQVGSSNGQDGGKQSSSSMGECVRIAKGIG